MSSPTLSDISQHNAEILEEQCHRIQWWHKEKLFLLCLQEAVEAYHVECAAHKARRKAEAKAKKKVEKQRLVKEEEKKKWLEYF